MSFTPDLHNLPKPFDTLDALVNRVDSHVKSLGGQGIDFVTASLLRKLVVELVARDPNLTAAHVEPICERISVGLTTGLDVFAPRAAAEAVDHTETEQ